MQTKIKIITVALSILFGILSFQNCSSKNGSLDTGATISAMEVTKLCGQEGYRYLMDHYFVAYCGGCHYKNSFVNTVPYFADMDFAFSYAESDYISKEGFIGRSTVNPFCTQPGCSLSTSSDLYKGLVHWLDNRHSCN